jgi:predicted nucleic acid-binding protein
MKTVLIDTNIFIGFDRGTSVLLTYLLKENEENDSKLFVCSLSEYEYYLGLKPNSVALKSAEKLFESIASLPLTRDISRIATVIARKHQIGMVDACIAASCLELKAQLATLNKKHFKSIKGVEFWEPQLNG